MATFAVAVAVMLSGFALAQRDADDGYYSPRGYAGSAQQYGYQNGYRDGYSKGQHEGRERDPNDYQTPDWRQATHGYLPWMGPVQVFQNGYRDGYRTGFLAGYRSVNARSRGDGDGDRDDIRPVYNSGYPYGSWGRGNVAYNFGYQDGAGVAREDIAQNKPYNPNPRGKYDDEDHGYRSGYGSKDAYRAQYASGYRAGYQSAFRRY
ncbi:MAG TPA: hypothetical protein VMT28_03425 [Terriglobales bacterium]|jgi:hypothetical protein|nr:hypothetical protein [Terriglobales bacterium]